MGLIDLTIMGVIIILVITYMTYTIIGVFGTIRYGWLVVIGVLIFDVFAAVFLVGFIILFPLLTVPAIIHFSIFVAPLNLTVVFGLIARYYLTRFCSDVHCYYPEVRDPKTGNVLKVECRKPENDGKYLPHTIDRISTKPYCKYLFGFRQKKE